MFELIAEYFFINFNIYYFCPYIFYYQNYKNYYNEIHIDINIRV